MLECIIKWLSFSCMNDHVLLVDRHLSCCNFLWAYIFSPCRHIPRSGTGLWSISRTTRSSKYVRMRIREWLRKNEQCISNPYHIYNKHSRRRMLVTATFITLILHKVNWSMMNPRGRKQTLLMWEPTFQSRVVDKLQGFRYGYPSSQRRHQNRLEQAMEADIADIVGWLARINSQGLGDGPRGDGLWTPWQQEARKVCLHRNSASRLLPMAWKPGLTLSAAERASGTSAGRGLSDPGSFWVLLVCLSALWNPPAKGQR